MKRFIAVLAGLLVLPAFAEVAPAYYDDAIEYSDEETPAADEVVDDEAVTVVVPQAQPSAANPRNANRNVSRAVPTTANKSGVSTRANSGRVVASRTTSNATTARGATRTTPRVTSRTSRNAAAQIASTRRAMQTVPANAARASIVQTDTVNTPLYTGRVSSRASAVRARIPTVTSISSNTSVDETSASTTSMDELAQITDFCKAQYTSCMDNFCNVLDDNQGRCSCSKNLKNYEKTEAALKSATEALQDVAQQIQYIGLSSDQIESLFTQTEAELQMQSSQDNTRLKNDLDRIRDLIVDVKSGSASSTATTDGLNFDLSGLLDFSIDSTGFDLSSLFGGTSSSNTSSISNQRGEQLYKTASARCKSSVLNNCAAQGVDISIITNSYDLEIDKQCIAYERSLTDANTEMNQTVRNAKSVLQRARLIVTKQKNNLTRLQCVQELDSCMRNEFVCGSEYEYCLDPTGKYIVNGAVVVGAKPGESGAAITGAVADGLYKMWNYESNGDNVNAWASSGSLPDFVNATIATDISDINSTSSNISEYLQAKIGYYNKSDNKNYGNCMSVLNQCQDYTYTGPNNNREYVVDNSVISDYLNRTLIQIKSAQDTILADYA